MIDESYTSLVPPIMPIGHPRTVDAQLMERCDGHYRQTLRDWEINEEDLLQDFVQANRAGVDIGHVD
ncbi:hypothetical protein MD484_g8675, partial [Candolleomyces efflorescens]